MGIQIELGKGNLKAKVFNAQLVSLIYNDIEYIHGGGKPEHLKTLDDKRGWQRSDNTIFPVVGPVHFKKYTVKVGNAVIPQDQHGIAGILHFHAKDFGSHHASLVQNHDGKSQIINPEYKHGAEGRPQHLEWPFAYTLEKTVKLEEDAVLITYTLKNESGEEMLFMFGAHPAFKVGGDIRDGVFEAGGNKHSIDDVIKTSKEIGALLLEGVDSVKYTNRGTGQGVEVSSKGFGNVMIWSPGKNAGMFCIEPVTQLPVLDKNQSYFFSGAYERLSPSHSAIYSYTIKPFNGQKPKHLYIR